MENWKLELQLTLENACFISIAKSLWNQEDTKVKIQNCSPKRLQLEQDWCHVEDYVLSKVNEIGLPGVLRSELELVIILLGDKIRGWLEYVNILGLDKSYAMNAPWTAHGTINKLHVTFPLENNKIANYNSLEEAASKMEAEKRSYMQMNEEEQRKNALCFINKIHDIHFRLDKSYLITEVDYFESALMLATNKLSENEMELFLMRYPSDILEFCLLNYGFQKLFHVVFCNAKEFLTAWNYYDLILDISLKESCHASVKSAAVDMRQNFVKSAFLLLWIEIPLEIKKDLILRSQLWEGLLSMGDTVIWKLIYNDKNLECHKNDMHSTLVTQFCSRISYTKMNLLRESNFDPVKVKELHVFEKIICGGDFYSTEQLAFLLGYLDEEKMINFKSQLDSCKICNYFIRRWQWDKIDEYLKWRFDTEEEVEIFKNRYKRNEFIYEALLEMWDDLDEVTPFLLWLFESEENIIKYKIKNPGMAIRVIRDLKYNKSKIMELFPHFEAFMKYWLLSCEDISSIKEDLLNYMD